jgi:HlyD family secretion protein
MSKKRILWILLALVVVAGVSGYAWYRFAYQPAQIVEDTEPELQTTRVRRGDLLVYASGVGSVIAAVETDLSFSSGGLLDELLVAVGDQVAAGDLLAKQGDLVSLESSVASARSNLLSAQAELDALNGGAELARATAEYDLLIAQQALADLEEDRGLMDYQRCSENTTDTYYADYLLAKSSYERLLDDFERNYAHRADDDLSRANAQSNLSAAEEDLYMALANLDYCRFTFTEDEIASAEAELSVARATLAQAEAAWQELGEDGLDDAAVQLAEQQVINSEIQLTLAEDDLESTRLLAPFDGTVMAVNADVGEIVSSSAIITLADLSLPLLEVFLDETDLGMIDVGYRVEVIFDALPDEVFSGEIIQVDPGLVVVSNVSYVRSVVLLDAESFAKPQVLPIGLNASVDVIGGEAQNALLVPVEALREIDASEYAVFVVDEDGQPKLRPVTVGLIDFTYAEIIDGLEEGEYVSTGIVETE